MNDPGITSLRELVYIPQYTLTTNTPIHILELKWRIVARPRLLGLLYRPCMVRTMTTGSHLI